MSARYRNPSWLRAAARDTFHLLLSLVTLPRRAGGRNGGSKPGEERKAERRAARAAPGGASQRERKGIAYRPRSDPHRHRQPPRRPSPRGNGRKLGVQVWGGRMHLGAYAPWILGVSPRAAQSAALDGSLRSILERAVADEFSEDRGWRHAIRIERDEPIDEVQQAKRRGPRRMSTRHLEEIAFRVHF